MVSSGPRVRCWPLMLMVADRRSRRVRTRGISARWLLEVSAGGESGEYDGEVVFDRVVVAMADRSGA